MVSELGQYLIEQLQKGYTRKQLKEHLIKHGYTSDMVTSAFAELTHEQLQQTEPNLKDFVESYISQGYKAEQLYASLKDEGYSKKLLDKTFKKIGKEHFDEPEHKPTKRWKKPDAIAIIMILPIFLFILILIYLFNTPSGEIPLVDDITNISTRAPISPKFNQTTLPLPSLQGLQNSSSFALAIHATNQTETIAYCNLISDEKKKDFCYSYAAEHYENGLLCQNITSVMLRDNCYMTFIIKGETSFCDELILPENKVVCQTI